MDLPPPELAFLLVVVFVKLRELDGLAPPFPVERFPDTKTCRLTPSYFSLRPWLIPLASLLKVPRFFF